MNKEKALEILKKNGKVFLMEMLEEVLVPALEEAVAKSENKIDDTVAGLLKEPLKAELKKLIEGL